MMQVIVFDGLRPSLEFCDEGSTLLYVRVLTYLWVSDFDVIEKENTRPP
jgi:hypothetical protein